MASVASQDCDAFEVVCCADRYGDEGLAELFERTTADAPFTSRVIEVDGGTAGRVRNVGFAAARTPWIAYLDGDDLLASTAIGLMFKAIASDAGDIYCSGMSRLVETQSPIVLLESLEYRPPLWIYDVDPDAVGHPTYFNQFQAIRSELWERYPFDESTNGEDIDYMLHQLLLGRFRKIGLPLYVYRQTPQSFSSQSFPGGDVCTKRYESGYYQDLFRRCYSDRLSDNFCGSETPRS